MLIGILFFPTSFFIVSVSLYVITLCNYKILCIIHIEYCHTLAPKPASTTALRANRTRASYSRSAVPHTISYPPLPRPFQVYISIVILASTPLGLNVTLDFYADVIPAPVGAARPVLIAVYVPLSGLRCDRPNAVTLAARGGGAGLVVRSDASLRLHPNVTPLYIYIYIYIYIYK